MRSLLLVLALILTIPASSASGRESGVVTRMPAETGVIRVVPRSTEAALVWAGDACWRGCAQDCGRQLRACLAKAAPESCLAHSDACDRFCQRECRRHSGPLLPLD